MMMPATLCVVCLRCNRAIIMQSCIGAFLHCQCGLLYKYDVRLSYLR